MRLRNIDLLKGLLILLVIVGHVVREEMSHSLLRTFIYSFHMPLFVAISGFLYHLSPDSRVMDLMKKYTVRLLLPWASAVLIYYFATDAYLVGDSWGTSLVDAFLYPYYHLWFIPAYLSWVAFTWLMRRLRLSHRQILWVGIGISAVAIILQQALPLQGVPGKLFYTFRPYLYLYFVVGLWYRHHPVRRTLRTEYIWPAICSVMVVYLYVHPLPMMSLWVNLLFSLSLIHLLLNLALGYQLPHCRQLEWLGTHSLTFYLWHVLPILCATAFIPNVHSPLFYIVTIALELVLVGLYSLYIKQKTT